VRLSREAILLEIAEANREIDRMHEVIDYVTNCDHHDPSHKSTLDAAFAKMEKCSKRINELTKMLNR
jgi:hypothetical protein